MTLELINKLDLFRRSLNGNSCRIERSKIGQFLTPTLIAQFMASLFIGLMPRLVGGELHGKIQQAV